MQRGWKQVSPVENRLCLTGRYGAAIEIALNQIAAQMEQHLRLRGLLDPLGDSLEAKTLSEAQYGRDNLAAALAAAHTAHKAGVHLDLVERQSAQVCQRGISRPEVVNGEPHTHLFQLVGNHAGIFKIADYGAFGDLDGQL